MTSFTETLAPTTVRSRDWSPRLDKGPCPRAKIGFVLISNDGLIEADMFRMAPPGVGLHFTRAAMGDKAIEENFAAMIDGLAEAASLIQPGFDDLDVVCYACTAGSVVIGEDRVIAELKRGAPTRKATTLLSGVIEGLRAFRARRIVVGTPYPDPINTEMAAYFRNLGFDIVDFQGLNLFYDTDILRVPPDYIAEFAQAIDHPDAEAIFLSCGAFRAIDALDAIEKATGKPVVSANQAMLWHCLRLAGIQDRIPGYGRLFLEH